MTKSLVMHTVPGQIPKVIPPRLVRGPHLPPNQVFMVLDPLLHDYKCCLALLQNLEFEDLVIVVPQGTKESTELEVLLMVVGTTLLSNPQSWILSVTEWGSSDEMAAVLAELEEWSLARHSGSGLIMLGSDVPQSSVLSRFDLHQMPVSVLCDSRTVQSHPMIEG